MPDETPFRIAFFVVMVLTLSVVAYHRRLAGASGERISHQAEGFLFAAGLRLTALVLFATTLAYLVYPIGVRWSMFPTPTWLRWAGVIVGLCCAPLMYWTLSSLGSNLTDTVVTRSNATLVCRGPYRWVRHPYYVVTALLMLSVTLLTANWLIGAASAAVLGLLALRTPLEEEKLLERFGDEYRNYMRRTGRFFPKFRRS